MNAQSFLKALVRRKKINDEKVDESKLSRCLSTFDLTCLGMFETIQRPKSKF